MVSTLWGLLLHAAEISPEKGLIFQEDGIDAPAIKVTYPELVAKSVENAKSLIASEVLKPGQIIGTYFTTHRENIEWCWSVIAAGGIPVILSPLSNDPTTLKSQIGNLSKVFEKPTVLTSKRVKHTFGEVEGLNLVLVEQIFKAGAGFNVPLKPSLQRDELAILLLTSGSTGHSKAVRYLHSQLVSSVRAKSMFHNTTQETTFMSWISFDHSANFCEVHINAMFTGSDQVHVSTHDLVTDPDQFFRLLSKHKIGYTFLPNFFLAAAIKAFNGRKDRAELDFSKLRVIMCGGEANRTATIVGAEHVLTQFGAPPHCVKAAYGLSETCSAAFYNTVAPTYDLKNEYVFASVGKHIPDAISLKIVDEDGKPQPQGSSGTILLRGPMVFESYHNNPVATGSSMTPDGWFDTGDLGTIDSEGNLRIVGRKKEIIILNGNNYSSFDIEHAIESSGISGLTTSYTASFSIHDEAGESESVVILFNPADEHTSPETLSQIIESIDKAVLRVCSQRAMAIIPLPKDQLPKSTIGKLSRAKLKAAYVAGQFDKFKIEQDLHDSAYASDSDDGNIAELSIMGRQILSIFLDNTKVPKSVLAGSDGLFAAGVDSVGYMRIKKSLEKTFNIHQELPMALLMGSHSVRALEEALYSIGTTPSHYDPIVPLRTTGSKAPIFLFHPGAGEFLVWVPFLEYLPDRPIYALRAKGLNKGEGVFNNLEEVLDCYHAAIKKTQAEGPYAFLGYCFGGMLAFETAKRFEAAGDKMAFVAGIDNPPDLKRTMGQLYYRKLMIDVMPVVTEHTVEDAERFETETADFTDEEFYGALFQKFSSDFIEQMDITPARLAAFGRVEDSMRQITAKYNPSGCVSKYDVFAADPMPHFNATPEEWKNDVLGGWKNYVGEESALRIHRVEGNHISLVKEPHIKSFKVVLENALIRRGI